MTYLVLVRSCTKRCESFNSFLSATSFRPELGLRVVDHLYRLKRGFKFVVNGPCFGGTNLVACGAETLCFTQTGEMGLWWGSINTPWNPVDESHRYLPLDVDVLLGYLELLKGILSRWNHNPRR